MNEGVIPDPADPVISSPQFCALAGIDLGQWFVEGSAAPAAPQRLAKATAGAVHRRFPVGRHLANSARRRQEPHDPAISAPAGLDPSECEGRNPRVTPQPTDAATRPAAEHHRHRTPFRRHTVQRHSIQNDVALVMCLQSSDRPGEVSSSHLRLGPTRQNNSPAPTSRFTARSASRLPNRQPTFRIPSIVAFESNGNPGPVRSNA